MKLPGAFLAVFLAVLIAGLWLRKAPASHQERGKDPHPPLSLDSARAPEEVQARPAASRGIPDGGPPGRLPTIRELSKINHGLATATSKSFWSTIDADAFSTRLCARAYKARANVYDRPIKGTAAVTVRASSGFAEVTDFVWTGGDGDEELVSCLRQAAQWTAKPYPAPDAKEGVFSFEWGYYFYPSRDGAAD